MATIVDICNSALAELGAEQITSLTDNNKRAKLCNLLYTKVKRKLLNESLWNFAIKRTTLIKDSFNFVDGDVTVGTDIINEVTHGKLTGDKLVLSTTGVLPTPLEEDIAYYVIKVDADNFKLALTFEDASNGTAIDITAAAGGGTHSAYQQPVYNFSYMLNLPSDYIRGIDFEYSDTEWQREGNKILSHDETMDIRYLADVDESLFTPSFEEALALNLAYKLSFSMVQSGTLRDQLLQDSERLLGKARSYDAQEGTPPELINDEFLTVRL